MVTLEIIEIFYLDNGIGLTNFCTSFFKVSKRICFSIILSIFRLDLIYLLLHLLVFVIVYRLIHISFGKFTYQKIIDYHISFVSHLFFFFSRLNFFELRYISFGKKRSLILLPGDQYLLGYIIIVYH